MIVQLDIDGTIDRAPEFFRWLTAALRRDGHKVCIVSSRTHSEENQRTTADELAGLGVAYDRLVLSPDPRVFAYQRLPADFNPAYNVYAGKLLAAQEFGAGILFDDCGVTAEIFRKHLPQVTVFRLLPPLPKR